MTDSDTFFDSLSASEGDFCEDIITRLGSEIWASPLRTAISNAGGICRESKSFLFELRFANALHECGIEPEYEVPGEGNSTIDFGFTWKDEGWSVELMRLEETAAVQSATQSVTDNDGMNWISRTLSSTADDQRQSEEGETLKAIERICQKCEKDGQPYKFPEPDDDLYVILVDFRTFLNGGDEADRVHVGLGGKYLKSGWFRRFWNGKLITGVFDEATKSKGAKEARERVHLIGFVNEREYKDGAFGQQIQFIANPYLFQSKEEAREAIETWPLQPTQVLNIGPKS